jgi:hypothetical protein
MSSPCNRRGRGEDGHNDGNDDDDDNNRWILPLLVADYAIVGGGGIAGVLFCGMVGCRLQVTNISFN